MYFRMRDAGIASEISSTTRKLLISTTKSPMLHGPTTSPDNLSKLPFTFSRFCGAFRSGSHDLLLLGKSREHPAAGVHAHGPITRPRSHVSVLIPKQPSHHSSRVDVVRGVATTNNRATASSHARPTDYARGGRVHASALVSFDVPPQIPWLDLKHHGTVA